VQVTIQYFAILRERRGLSIEQIETSANTPRELYEDRNATCNLSIAGSSLRFAVNDEFVPADYKLCEGDTVSFIAPVAGG
jgi:molybdopterin converting factor small subunit